MQINVETKSFIVSSASEREREFCQFTYHSCNIIVHYIQLLSFNINNNRLVVSKVQSTLSLCSWHHPGVQL